MPTSTICGLDVESLSGVIEIKSKWYIWKGAYDVISVLCDPFNLHLKPGVREKEPCHAVQNSK